ncbi:hypothetical protein LPW11_08700 [Geomonas sp. RF6]|uniref:FlgO family outer membrane protein n=1 Tax=Geomonas sp. RF6 TaxID=2897342 RepID=UPI001E57BAB2|nr:FlgO family outer membrane protein [Geomonas sp. RF6]UFS72257.1 hypothetical protein LPW11_08700 [Geomonas sp. RF6]
MKLSLILCGTALFTSTLAGAAYADEVVHVLGEGHRYIINEPLPVHRSRTSVGNFNGMVIYLADQLERNLDRKVLGNTVIVSTFSNLDRLSETTSLGRLLGESIIHELQVRRWNVVDVRLTRDIVVNDAGEFSLSRDIKKIRDIYKVGGVVTGTYSISESGVIINARAIDLDSGLVQSSAQAFIPLSNFAESMLHNPEKMPVMRVVGDR